MILQSGPPQPCGGRDNQVLKPIPHKRVMMSIGYFIALTKSKKPAKINDFRFSYLAKSETGGASLRPVNR
jgi:hypothetical protein